MSEEEKLDMIAEALFDYELMFWMDLYPKNGTIQEKKLFFKRFWVAERD